MQERKPFLARRRRRPRGALQPPPSPPAAASTTRVGRRYRQAVVDCEKFLTTCRALGVRAAELCTCADITQPSTAANVRAARASPTRSAARSAAGVSRVHPARRQQMLVTLCALAKCVQVRAAGRSHTR